MSATAPVVCKKISAPNGDAISKMVFAHRSLIVLCQSVRVLTMLSVLFGVCSALSAGVAAVYWLRASKIDIPLAKTGWGGTGDNFTAPLREASRLNAVAARWACGSALAGAAATLSSLIPS